MASSSARVYVRLCAEFTVTKSPHLHVDFSVGCRTRARARLLSDRVNLHAAEQLFSIY